MMLSQTSGSLYGVVITAYEFFTTPFIFIPDLNRNNSQIYFKLILSALEILTIKVKMFRWTVLVFFSNNKSVLNTIRGIEMWLKKRF
jgi:hypothetical protein